MASKRPTDGTKLYDPSDAFARQGAPFGTSEKFAQTGTLGLSGLVQRFLNLGGNEALTAPFVENSWVYSCVTAIARAVTSVPLRILQDDSSSAKEISPDHPVAEFFNRPNPLLTKRKLVRQTAVNQNLWGEAFWFLLARGRAETGSEMQPIADGQIPEEAWIVRSDRVTLKLDDNTKLPKEWKVTTTEKEIVFPAHAVFHPFEADPYNPMRGIGPMQAAWRTAQQDFASERYDEGLLANGGEPGGFYKLPGTMSDTQKDRLREQHQKRFGGADGNRKVGVLDGGAEWIANAFSPKDMEFKDMRVWHRDQILSIFGVPKTVIGIVEDVNRSNGREQVRLFWENTVLPTLSFMEDEINAHFLGRINDPSVKRMRARFDTSDVEALREDVIQQIDAIEKLMRRGLSFNEAAKIVGLQTDDIEGGDDHYVDASMIPADMAGVQLTQGSPGNTGGPNAPSESSSRAFKERRAVSDEIGAARAKAEKAIAAKVKGPIQDYILAQRKKLNDLAAKESSNGSVNRIAGDRKAERELRRILNDGLGDWTERLYRNIDGAFDRAWLEAAAVVAASPEDVFDPKTEDAVEFLAMEKHTVACVAMETVSEEVRKSIMEVIGDGSEMGLTERVTTCIQAINEKMRAMKNNVPARAQRIARASAISIGSRARAEQMQSDGVEKHVWITSKEGFVREPHGELDGRIRKIGEEFDDGLRFPGEHDDCSCATAPA